MPLDVGHYNVYMRAQLDNGHDFSPADVLAAMESAGLQPAETTFALLLAAYCRRGDLAGAAAILEVSKCLSMAN